MDRVVAGLCALLVRPARFARVAVVIKPSTLLSFHRALVKRKYRSLFSAKRPAKPGPKGPTEELIAVIVQMKEKTPRFGCPRIAQQLSFIIWFRHRQGRGSARTGTALSADSARRRSLLADLFGPHERQPVVGGHVSMRIANPALALGHAGHGPIHPTHRWIRRSQRRT